MKKYGYYLLTFLSSLIVITTIYIMKGVTPFGNNTLLTIDFFHQYGPMLGELYNRVTNHSQLIYSFNMGMGLPFFRNFFTYLSSPFNFITFLFNHRHLLTSYSVIIGLKACASSITMTLFLEKKWGKKYLFIPLSILYAFDAYFVAYYWNIMWIDGMVMLPIVILGIEKLIKENKGLLYCISLAITILSNYFIGYMICLFSILYFITYLIIYTKKWDIKVIFKKILLFGLYSLISGGLCAFFLIPMYLALKGTSTTNDTLPFSLYYSFTFKEFIFNHLSGVGSTVLSDGITVAPNISCGITSVFLIIIFWVNSSISLKTKLMYTVLLLFLTFSFVFAPLDFIWHAFHVPNDLPYRFSFLYCFLFVLMGAHVIANIKELKTIQVIIAYIICMIMITLALLLNFKNIEVSMIILNYVIINVLSLSYLGYKYLNHNKIIISSLLLLTIIECIITINNNWSIDQKTNELYNNYQNIKNINKQIKQEEQNNMYRIEQSEMLSFNDPSWYSYYGQIGFSSMEYENMAILQNALGMPGNEINSFYYKENTPIYDLMFNLKYVIGSMKSNNIYTKYKTNNNLKVYKNNYNLGLMFSANNDIKTFNSQNTNPINNQNNFIYKATGVKDVVEKCNNVESEIVYKSSNKTIVKYKIPNHNDNFYFYLDKNSMDFLMINKSLYYVNDDYDYFNTYNSNLTNDELDLEENYLITETSNKPTIEFYIGYNNYSNTNPNVYKLNLNKFNQAYNYLNNYTIEITKFNENIIKAISSNDKDMTVYTSIPYDEGWHVYIDGVEQKTFKIADTLLAFDLKKGKHKITIKYKIPYFKTGLIISIISGITLIIIIYINIEIVKKSKNFIT